MIYVRLSGGLGNQFFQYAAARELAISRGVEVVLDLDFYTAPSQKTTKREYELGNYPIVARIAGKDDDRMLRTYRPKLWRLVRRYAELPGKLTYVHEPINVPAKGGFHVPAYCYLDGYWQSEHYFSKQGHAIRSELSSNVQLSHEGVTIACRLAAENSVAIHIRRGDYAYHAGTNAVHGVLGLGYYECATRQIAAQVHNPTFFVFSDDLDWVRKNFVIPYALEYVSYENASSNTDLKLMSLCKHAIIANSTFSWWAAWLNNNPSKKILGPKRWFANGKLPPEGLFPAGWTLIDG